MIRPITKNIIDEINKVDCINKDNIFKKTMSKKPMSCKNKKWKDFCK